MHILHPNRRLHTHPFLRQQIHQQWAWPTVPLGLEDGLAALVLLHAVEVAVKEVGGVERATFGFWVKLCAEYWAGFMYQS